MNRAWHIFFVWCFTCQFSTTFSTHSITATVTTDASKDAKNGIVMMLNDLLDRSKAKEALNGISQLTVTDIYTEGAKLTYTRALVQVNQTKEGET